MTLEQIKEALNISVYDFLRENEHLGKHIMLLSSCNPNTIGHGKLGKHMMHLIQLYLMCLDILEQRKIVTYREKEHGLLMDIRNGKYLDGNRQPVPEFFQMVDDYEKRVEYAARITDLPEEPDYGKIREFTASVNERIVKDEL